MVLVIDGDYNGSVMNNYCSCLLLVSGNITTLEKPKSKEQNGANEVKKAARLINLTRYIMCLRKYLTVKRKQKPATMEFKYMCNEFVILNWNSTEITTTKTYHKS